MLIKKVFDSLKRSGIRGTAIRTKSYIRRHILKRDGDINHSVENMAMVDVLFIDGCGELVPHPPRYRITHQREQLEAGGLSTDQVFYCNLTLEHVKFAHTFVFFRTPSTELIEEFIPLAKSLGKTVLFDIDDLVIDTKYTDNIPYVKGLNQADKACYDDGVIRMGKTLSMCEAAITTTERLAEELSHYVPEVFINRNTASGKMYDLSLAVNKNRDDDEIRIGYFSGSITHNADFEMIQDVICGLLGKYENLRLYLVGELDLPPELKKYSKQIKVSPFLDWKKLPQLIADVDINIAPLEDDIFNEAKSENKWVEAALVKVPTVASDVGAFARMIQDGQTGFLCKTSDEWRDKLESLILDENLRREIANNAFDYCKSNCVSVYSCGDVTKYIKSKTKKNAMLSLPSTEISGGIMVALKHASYLQDEGYSVTIYASNPHLDWLDFYGYKFPVISWQKNEVAAYFDKGIATMWLTAPDIYSNPRIREKYYLVQNYEPDFYSCDDPQRVEALKTYNYESGINYITISKWCQNWLESDFGVSSKYAPNGISCQDFVVVDRDYSGKIRILIEGDCAVDYKRVDECFQITNSLDRDRYEVWYMSYNATPKPWYKYDKFLHKVPYEEVANVYGQCHILLKASILESFSYPPLEMMATGGLVVVVPNDGNAEYIRKGENCLCYESGDVESAVSCIEKLVNDSELRHRLTTAGRETAERYDWDSIRGDILKLYL